MVDAGNTGYEQNPRTIGPGTVPKGPPKTNAPQEVQAGTSQTIPPGKPSAVTGPGGPSISIPKVGKSGK